MSVSVADARASATRIAKWLLDKGRTDDAVNLLSAWAVAGPNDPSGQALLAEALRIAPGSPVAKMAFERMEGMQGNHGPLDAAVKQFSSEEIARLEGEMKKPSFRRAQVGFNNNVKYKDHVYHVQTEDSGLDKPHIITHLFADGGRIIKSHKRTYADAVQRPDVTLYVRALMKGQHMEMVLALREGRFDKVIEGKAMGGIETLTGPPAVNVAKRPAKDGSEAAAEENPLVTAAAAMPDARPPAEAPAEPPRTQVMALPVTGENPIPPTERAPQGPIPASSTPMRAAQPTSVSVRAAAAATAAARASQAGPSVSRTTLQSKPVLYRLQVMRSLHGGPPTYEITDGEALIGQKGAVSLAGERFCHPREGVLRLKGGKVFVEDFGTGSGIFLRIRTPVELELGDEFIVGDQLLRVAKNPTPQNGPDPGPTYYYSSPTWVSSFRIVQIFQGGSEGACVVARGSTLVVGSTLGDLILKNDPLVADQHCLVEEQAGVIVLTDLASRTGVFVRIRGEQELQHGDELLIGRTRLLTDLAAR